MKKKTYIHPEIRVVRIQHQCPILVSSKFDQLDNNHYGLYWNTEDEIDDTDGIW